MVCTRLARPSGPRSGVNAINALTISGRLPDLQQFDWQPLPFPTAWLGPPRRADWRVAHGELRCSCAVGFRGPSDAADTCSGHLLLVGRAVTAHYCCKTHEQLWILYK